MGLVREPLDVDFYVDPKPLTKEEKEAISKYIREYKAKHAVKKTKEKNRKNSLVKKTA
jgi:hypothetical protein